MTPAMHVLDQFERLDEAAAIRVAIVAWLEENTTSGYSRATLLSRDGADWLTRVLPCLVSLTLQELALGEDMVAAGFHVDMGDGCLPEKGE